MSLTITNKPTIDAQIAFIRKDIKSLENGRMLSEDAKQIAEYNSEIEMCRAIMENLIAVKLWNQSELVAKVLAGDDGDIEFPEPHMDRTQAFKWPRVGTSVTVELRSSGKTEWVDAYVIDLLKPGDPFFPGVKVRTFYQSILIITNPLQIKTVKEVSNG